MDEVLEPPSFEDDVDHSDDPLYAESQMLANAKKLALFSAGAASQKYMNALADQQEVMADLADIIIQVYALSPPCCVPASSELAACPSPTRHGDGSVVRGQGNGHCRACFPAHRARRRRRRHLEGSTRHRPPFSPACSRDVYARSRDIARHLVEYGVWT